MCFGLLGGVIGKNGDDEGEEKGGYGVLVMGDDDTDHDGLLLLGDVFFGDVGGWVVDDCCGDSGSVILVLVMCWEIFCGTVLRDG